MSKVLSPEVLREAVLEINGWHPNVPLILVFSRQRLAPDGLLEGGNQAVTAVYNTLFSLEHIGISDDARKFYLHLCHGQSGDAPYGIKKPTTNYAKTHQRIIKDTFGQQFLSRRESSRYQLREGFVDHVKDYLGIQNKIDLRPLVLFHYWNNLEGSETLRPLWERFSAEYGAAQEPYCELFTCTQLDETIDTVGDDQPDLPLRVKQIMLPSEYGVGEFNADFWMRFRSNLEARLRKMKWQGDSGALVENITAALHQDQSLFLLGDPGTGKTTLVLEAVLPALRETFGLQNEIALSYHTLTPYTSISDLFGFQGLDGSWIEGPLVKEVLARYQEDQPEDSENSQKGFDDVPRLIFLDEANRVDIEALLSPLQAAFDRLQKRKEPPLVTLGSSQYIAPKRVWRIFAGNSPISDSGRREQSRPFKRRLATVIPPDPMQSSVASESSFRRLCLEILEKASKIPDPEVSEPALALYGQYSANSARIENLRLLLAGVKRLHRVAVTVGLVESILLRASSFSSIQPEGSLDAAVCASLIGVVSGERSIIEDLIDTADTNGFSAFGRSLRDHVLEQQSASSLDLDSIM